jgi:4-aminobutyrate aminotransferase-like enzyme
MELVKDRKTKAYGTEEAVAFMDECKDRGLLLGKGGLMGNVVRIAPPMNITREDVKFMLETMAEAFVALEKKFGKVAV